MSANGEVTLAQVVAALSVTYKPEGVLIWLESMRRKHSTAPAVLAEHVRRIGDADPSDFTVEERSPLGVVGDET